MDIYTCKAKKISDGKWVYGYVGRMDYMSPELFLFGVEFVIHKINPDTICRFIGKKDKHDNPIFEHDLVRTEFGRICEVVWFSSPQHHGWDLIPVNNFDCKPPRKDTLWCMENFEIIGNKFDNTNLMEGVHGLD